MKNFTTRVICFSVLALGIASAADPYNVTVLDAVSVGKTELKPGEYKVEMQGDKAIFTLGKKTVAVPATLSKGEQPFTSTVFISQHSKLKEIDLGGTQDKIVFDIAAK
jgi:hypothetical protein